MKRFSPNGHKEISTVRLGTDEASHDVSNLDLLPNNNWLWTRSLKYHQKLTI